MPPPIDSQCECEHNDPDREDASAMVTAGATANITEENRRASWESVCWVHVHTWVVTAGATANTTEDRASCESVCWVHVHTCTFLSCVCVGGVVLLSVCVCVCVCVWPVDIFTRGYTLGGATQIKHLSRGRAVGPLGRGASATPSNPPGVFQRRLPDGNFRAGLPLGLG